EVQVVYKHFATQVTLDSEVVQIEPAVSRTVVFENIDCAPHPAATVVTLLIPAPVRPNRRRVSRRHQETSEADNGQPPTP
ncbi:hypothetical protein, partial [Planctomicrobium piriforme]|uniref:hypothetical protein n=1 Tax=Planctomicrobium piriforme TaxID=1576369 RepID=UPI001C31D238